MLIDGKKINEEIGRKLLEEIKKLDVQPSLGILCVGDDPASLSYLKMKKEFGETYGFLVNLYNLDGEITEREVIKKIENMQTENDGVMLQLPLPVNLKESTLKILENIKCEKDVDVLTKKSLFISPIVLSLQKVCDLQNKKVAVVGLGKLVGLPIRDFLKENKFNYVEVLKCEYEKIKDCDVVISGIGKANAISSQFIKDGVVLVDYGWDKVDGVLTGDFAQECYSKCYSYTPVPGGMGPIVVACLFSNVLEAKIKQIMI